MSFLSSFFRRIKKAVLRTFNIRRAFQFVWESAPGWTAASTAILLVEGLLPVASLYMLKLMLDGVSAALQSPNPLSELRHVLILVAAAGGIALVNSLVNTFGSIVTQVQGRAVADHMFDVLHAKSIEVDLEYYENAEYYDTLHRAQEDASYRPVMIVNGVAMILRSSISILGLAGLLFTFHWSIALVLIAAVLPSVLVRLRFSNLMYKLQRQYTGTERQVWYYHWMMTSVDYAKEIRVFGLGTFLLTRYNQMRQVLRQLRMGLDVRRSSLEMAAQALANAVIYASYGFIAYRVLNGFATLGDLAMYYQAFQRGQGFLGEVLGGVATLYESNLFLTNLYDFLDLKPKVSDPAEPRIFPKIMQKGITFDHISFTYANSDREALCDVSLEIHPGEVIALVGENGSGKTTLVKLLCRLYEPTQGEIRVDDLSLRDFRIADLRKEIGVIFQDYAHYNLPARENIWFGDVDQPADDERIHTAAMRADAHKTILSLKQGYDTVLGKLFENGEELSIGQWQKIALARAFLRSSQVIVLDEPTSAMDPRAEYEVFLKFRELLENRTAVLISHRLSTVRMADRIYVMQSGKIVENGTHAELIARDGLYARLYEIQARQYQTTPERGGA
jgi:ATP-binding cassette, subfamily B, bacterial